MAIMIPKTMTSDNHSAAEEKIFENLKNDATTADWYVMHSYVLTEHPKYVIGEADFVVLAPDLGIFVLEVKGGRVYHKDRKWYFVDKYDRCDTKSEEKSPFKQASNGMFAIRDYINKQVSSEIENPQRLLCGFGVLFPDIEFDKETTLEFNKERVFDSTNKMDISGFIRHLAEFEANCLEEKNISYRVPSKKEINIIASLLRDDFSCDISFLSDLNDVSAIQKKLTERQYLYLDTIESNPRCLVTGLAGTGKTVLAFEAARMYKRMGYSVCYLCFNKKLSNFIDKQFTKISTKERPDYVGTLHTFMMSKVYCDNHVNTDNYYRNILTAQFLNSEDCKKIQYDVLIVDEVQDIIDPKYLAVLDSILRDGLFHGVWSFFGDLAMQNLYNKGKSFSALVDCLGDYCGLYSHIPLKVNCRNTNQIHDEVQTVFDIPQDKWRVDASNQGPKVVVKGLLKSEDKAIQVRDYIKVLLKDVPKDNLTILSYKKFENSLVYDYRNELDIYNYDAYRKRKGIQFSTIHGFKGLEDSVIVVTDFSPSMPQDLLYVAMTRARYKLVLLLDEDDYGWYYRELKGGLHV